MLNSFLNPEIIRIKVTKKMQLILFQNFQTAEANISSQPKLEQFVAGEFEGMIRNKSQRYSK